MKYFFPVLRVADNRVVAEVRFLEPETSAVSRRAFLRGRRHFVAEVREEVVENFSRNKTMRLWYQRTLLFLSGKQWMSEVVESMLSG